MLASVRRDGHIWEQKFRCGDPATKMKKVGKARGAGTSIYFQPDPKIFPKTEFSAGTIKEHLEVASYLHKGLKVTFDDRTSNRKYEFMHDGGN